MVLIASIKTIKTGFDGFDGSYLTKSPRIEAEPSDQEVARASAILSQVGVRLMRLEGHDTVGIWSDLDSPEVRAALHAFGSSRLPVLYLDGPGVPPRYKVRRVAGDPVPTHIRQEMERHPDKPWSIRDRRNCRFVLWPLADAKPWPVDPQNCIRRVSEWGSACGSGLSKHRPR
jgi:hypothetical protein